MSGQQQLPLGFEVVKQEQVKQAQAVRRERPVLRSGSRLKELAGKETVDTAALSGRERKQWLAIDAVLADQPEAFKRTVFELCRQLGWPDDEPGFLLAIVSNRLFALAQQYPQLLSEAMQGATKDAFERWRNVETKLDVAAVKHLTALGQLDTKLLQVQTAALDQVQGAHQLFERERGVMQRAFEQERLRMVQVLAQERSALADERGQLQTLLEQERSALADEREAMRALLVQERSALVETAQRQVEAQKVLLEKRAADSVAAIVERAQQGMDKEVRRIMKVVRPKHYAESVLWVVLAVAMMSSVSWLSAWVSRGRAEEATQWGDIERWNQDHLKACIEAGETTCNFHIEVPQKKKS